MMPTFPSPSLRYRKAGFPRYGLYGAFLVKGGRSTTFSFLSSPFLLFDRAPQAFFRPDRKMPKPTRAAAVKDGAFFAPPGRGLSLTDVRTAACCNGRVRLD
jgi:hypothetical protein